MKSIVIIGYGQLGIELAKKHLLNDDSVTSVSRTEHKPLSPDHCHISADLDSLLTPLILPTIIDCLYYLAPPSDIDLTDQRLKLFLSQHASLKISHIIYISTTGVYGSSNGDWITENTATHPAADRAKRRLDAEQQLINYQQQSGAKLTILRCAAIYSAKTVNKKRIAANKKPVLNHLNAPYTNRIHIADLTEVCWQAMLHQPEDYEIYNVSDGHPSTTTEHAWLLADLAGVARNREIELSEAGQYYSPAYMSYLRESKKLDISKLRNKLKPVFKYEDCVQGIKQCFDQSDSK